MGSGEADGYTVTVSDNTSTNKLLDSASVTTAARTDNWGVWHPYETAPVTSSNVYFGPRTVYYYQIRCPKPNCKTFNWCELDKTVTCKDCGSRLRAVSKDADYEITVNR